MLSMIANPVTALPVVYPRSGLSRSDLVLWPIATESPAPLSRQLSGHTRTRREQAETDAVDRAPQGREPSVREALTRTIVDWSGSWQAAGPGNWLGRSPATKAALGC